MTSWARTTVAPDRTHHLLGGRPLSRERFEEVMAFHAPGLAPVRRGGEAWHIGPRGDPAYCRRFVRVFGFYEGLACVFSKDGCHHISPDGTDAYPERFAWCGNFQEGRCTVRDADGQYFHITPEGTAAYPERWRYAGDYREGLAVVQAEDGLSTHIDRSGRLVHGRWFVDLDAFHKGLARARDQNGWMHVDVSGLPAYERRFARVEPFYNGQARVETDDGGLEIVDERGITTLNLRSAQSARLAARLQRRNLTQAIESTARARQASRPHHIGSVVDEFQEQ